MAQRAPSAVWTTQAQMMGQWYFYQPPATNIFESECKNSHAKHYGIEVTARYKSHDRKRALVS
jgi:hypothetical protein